MGYHAAGLVNAVVYAFTLYGIGAQVALIWRRRALGRQGRLPESPTAVLSLNQFAVSFLGYFAFFVYGCLIEPFNHYLVWTRLPGSLLVQLVLFEIARDRAQALPRSLFAASAAAMVAGLGLLASGLQVAIGGRLLGQVLLLAVTALVSQGLAHQVVLIRRTGLTGAVSARMYVATSVKDLSLLAFGLAMGPTTGWPLALMACASLVVKAVLLWHFRWVRVSPAAALRRSLAAGS